MMTPKNLIIDGHAVKAKNHHRRHLADVLVIIIGVLIANRIGPPGIDNGRGIVSEIMEAEEVDRVT